MTSKSEEIQPKHDPYTLLNVTENATDEEIQKSYKFCSRSFHPDKQPQIKQQAAQEVFIEFKKAYDILMDPILRFAYDEYGYKGVSFIRFLRKQHKEGRNNDNDDDYDDNHDDQNNNPNLALILALLKQNNKHAASYILTDCMQFHRYQANQQRYPIYCDMECECSTLHTQLLGEGDDPMIIPEVEKSSMSFLIKIPPTSTEMTSTNSKNQYEIGGSCAVIDGNSKISGSLGFQCEPVQGTDVKYEWTNLLDSNPSKVSVSTTRILSSGTSMTVGLASSISSNKIHDTNKQNEPMSLSMTTKRLLNEGNLYGVFSVGMGSNRDFHYTFLSLTSLYPHLPRSTLTLSLGADPHPFQFQIYHPLYYTSDSKQTKKTKQSNIYELLKSVANRYHLDNGSNDDSQMAQTSIKIGFDQSIQWKTTLTRTLSSMVNLTLGVQHITKKGFAFLFGIESGTISIHVPILVTSASHANHLYHIKALYTCCLTLLLNELITEWIEYAQISFLRHGGASLESPIVSRDEESLEWNSFINEQLDQWNKAKKDAYMQTQRMIPQAKQKMLLENEKQGLVILKATYGILDHISKDSNDEYMLDVTTQLQFWVKDSKLILPPLSKDRLMGFYNVSHIYWIKYHMKNPKDSSTFSWLWNQLQYYSGLRSYKNIQHDNVKVKLVVRYQFRNDIYEISILDNESLELPSKYALKLGSSKIVS